MKFLTLHSLFAIALLTVTVVFYGFRDRVENYFYDIRTQLKSDSREVDNVILVAIDKQTTAPNTTLSLEKLQSLLTGILDQNPRHLLYIDWEHTISPEKSILKRIGALLSNDTRVTIGLPGFGSTVPLIKNLPQELSRAHSQIFPIDTLKKRSNSVVRKLPTRMFMGLRNVPSAFTIPAGGLEESHILLNYISEENFPTLSASQILDHTSGNILKDKIVVLGYTYNFKLPGMVYDYPLVNTPLKGDLNTYEEGAPFTYVVALAVENAVNNTYLKESSMVFPILQTIIVAILLFLAWSKGAVVASFTFIGLSFFIIFIHTLLFEKYNLFIPLSDTFLFGSAAYILGGIQNLFEEIKKLSSLVLKDNENQAVNSIQSRFLEDFAKELIVINSEVKKEFTQLPSENFDPTSLDVLQRALVSCTDFEEYLNGIKQLSEVESFKFSHTKKTSFKIKRTVVTMLRFFDEKITSRQQKIHIECEDDLTIHSYQNIIETIIFNFLSNAVKYTPDHGNISIVISKAGKTCKISVHDSGPGIEAEYTEKIFEKFYRIKNDDVYRIKGTGLGLYLCKFFADKIGARIRLESSPENGSTFTLEVK